MAVVLKDTPEMPVEGLPYWKMELAVPLLSFGGALLAIIIGISNIPLDFRISILGCVLASWVLAYLAWIRPHKDIVALSTPLYSFIFIVVPTDVLSSIVLELLYAASLTILLVRLKKRFGSPGAGTHGVNELAGPLKAYVGQTAHLAASVSPEAGHSAAVTFVRFAEGDYRESARLSGAGAKTVDSACVARAFAITSEHAGLLDRSLPRPQGFLTFSPEDAGLLALPASGHGGNDQEFDRTIDNALLLLFSIAWTASERDRPYLKPCESFAQKLMSDG